MFPCGFPDGCIRFPHRGRTAAYLKREIEGLIALAERNSPRLRGAEHAIAGAMAQRSAASLDYYPDFNVAGRYEQVEGGTNPGFSNDGDDIFTISLGLNLPLQTSRRSAAVREADAAIRKNKAEYQRIKREIHRNVVIAFERLVELRHEAHLLKDTLLPQTTQHLGSAQRIYETGTLDFLSLLDAEKNIEGIRRDYARVAAEFQKAKASLKRAVGGTLK